MKAEVFLEKVEAAMPSLESLEDYGLDEDEIERLGTEGMGLGDESLLVATVRVVSVSSREDEGGKTSSMRLILTEGTIENPSKSQAEKIFGDK